MIRKLTLTALTALGLTAGAALANEGAGGYGHVEDHAFSFEGPFGKFDQVQLQRGLKVYADVCSACHGLKYVPLRELSEPGGPGYSEEEVRAFAAEYYEVFDAELDDYRPATPADHFPTVSGQGLAPGLAPAAVIAASYGLPA